MGCIGGVFVCERSKCRSEGYRLSIARTKSIEALSHNKAPGIRRVLCCVKLMFLKNDFVFTVFALYLLP